MVNFSRSLSSLQSGWPCSLLLLRVCFHKKSLQIPKIDLIYIPTSFCLCSFLVLCSKKKHVLKHKKNWHIFCQNNFSHQLSTLCPKPFGRKRKPPWPAKELKAHFARCLALVREAGGCVVADAAGRVLAVATGEVTPRAPLQHPAMVAIEKVAEEARKRPGDWWRWLRFQPCWQL